MKAIIVPIMRIKFISIITLLISINKLFLSELLFNIFFKKKVIDIIQFFTEKNLIFWAK